MPQTHRHFTPEFKLEIAKKIVDQQHNISALCRELELSETAVRRWAAQYRAERQWPARHRQTADPRPATHPAT